MTPNQRKWLAVLESGEYKQSHEGYLCQNGKYCCLGVAAEIFKTDDIELEEGTKGVIRYDNEQAFTPCYVVKALHLRSELGDIEDTEKSLTEMNDTGSSFEEIAKFIRENPDLVFNKTQEDLS